MPPVNVVIGGSPCQDLSVAGRRAGLAGERSGLFTEQLRVIKEMRKSDADRGISGNELRPRFMVWENVPGAFSSNGGADFGAVLQETIRVVEEETPAVPMPKNGWPLAGCLYGADRSWSVAWRVFDARFWGTPQRRRRIALIADFGGMSAPEILFERESVCGDTQESGAERQGTSAVAENGVKLDDAAGFNGQRNIAAVDFRNFTENNDVNGTLQAGTSLNLNNCVRVHYIVRRLTPLECERLQGFPDGWTDIGEWADSKGNLHKESTDSARYKALGNSIALPSWLYVLQKLSLCCVDKTMASLFDGIGGFPLLWETLNGKGSCLWVSEIEEFPIAVTRKRFPED